MNIQLSELKQLNLSSEDIAALSGDYTPEDCMSAIKHGMAVGLQELQILPSEFEKMAKLAAGNPLQWLADFAENYGALTATSAALGGLGGAYTGYLRHRAEKAIEGKNDPDIVALQDKIRAYNEMTRDLKRTDVVTGVAPPAPVAA